MHRGLWFKEWERERRPWRVCVAANVSSLAESGLELECRPFRHSFSPIFLYPTLTSLCENTSFAPLGLSNFACAPTACAVGCILTPLRGCKSEPSYHRRSEARDRAQTLACRAFLFRRCAARATVTPLPGSPASSGTDFLRDLDGAPRPTGGIAHWARPGISLTPLRSGTFAARVLRASRSPLQRFS